MVFSSKKDIWIGGVIWGAISIGIYYLCIHSIFVEFDLVAAIAAFILIVICSAKWFYTKYQVEKGFLEIYSGLWKKTIIPIERIQSIRYTKDVFTGPSLSIDRIEINYNQYETICISPKERQRFLDEILHINPNIHMNRDSVKLGTK